MIYAIYNPTEQKVKIGYTEDIRQRMADLQTGSATPLTLLGWCDGDHFREQQLHYHLRNDRVNGEWFNLTVVNRLPRLFTLFGQSAPSSE